MGKIENCAFYESDNLPGKMVVMEAHHEREEDVELCRLKELLPSVSVKDNVTQLDVILEAIRYIASLRNQLERRIGEEEEEEEHMMGTRRKKANQKKILQPLPCASKD